MYLVFSCIFFISNLSRIINHADELRFLISLQNRFSYMFIIKKNKEKKKKTTIFPIRVLLSTEDNKYIHPPFLQLEQEGASWRGWTKEGNNKEVLRVVI